MSQTDNGCDSKYEEIQIPVPWGHISGKWWGKKSCQPILAIHGWQDNCGTFDPLAELLAERGHSVLCIDLPGHGHSSHFAPGHFYYVFWDGIHLVRRIVKHFKWDKIKILGHSLGGGIAFLYAASYPEDIASYVSLDISSPSVRDPTKMLGSVSDCVDKFLKYETLSQDQQPCYDYNEMIDIVHGAYNQKLTRQSCEIMMRRGMKEAAERPGKFIFNRDPRLKVAILGFMTPDQVLLMAKAIKCKVMNIRAKDGNKFDFPGLYEQVLDTIAENAEVMDRQLVDGGHHVHLNDAASIVDIVDRFLSK